MKILLIHPDPERAADLERELTHSAQVESTRDGLYALTMIERSRPDLVLISDRVRGLEPTEILEIVRGDPSLSAVRVGLMSSANGSGFTHRDDLDLMLSESLTASQIGSRIQSLASNGAGQGAGNGAVCRPQPAPRPDGGSAASGGNRRRDRATLRGALSTVELLDLAQRLSQTRESGRLVFDLAEVEAEVYLAEGLAVHATAAGLTGLAAFAEVLRRGELTPAARFHFEPLPASELFSIPRTINMTVEQLLLLIAVDSDGADEPSREVKR